MKDSRGDRDRDKSKDKDKGCDSLDKKFVVDGVVRHSNSWIPQIPHFYSGAKRININ